MVTYLFFAYFIRVYVIFIIVKICGFVIAFVILAMHYIFDLKLPFLMQKPKNLMTFLKKLAQ